MLPIKTRINKAGLRIHTILHTVKENKGESKTSLITLSTTEAQGLTLNYLLNL